MTDDSLEERLADLESGKSASSQSSFDSSDSSSDGPVPIGLTTRFWTVSVLVPQVRIFLGITPVVGMSPTGRSMLLASLIGGVVVAECLLRGFGPAIASALSKGLFDAVICAIGALVVSAIATGYSPPDPVIGTGVLAVSALVTARQYDRTETD